MRRTQSINPRLQERLASLQREINRVEGDIHTLSKAVDNPDRTDALRQLRQFGSGVDGAKVAEPRVAGQPPSRLVPREDLFEKATAAPVAEPVAGLEDQDMTVPKPVPDQRFANYFVTGGLHSVRPLRQEKRVQRNKAIVMLIIAVLVVYGVIHLLF